jgi:mono/diheme cytochrome c family protein
MNKVLRRTGIGVGILLGVLVLAAAGVWVYGGRLDSRTVTAPATEKPFATVTSSPELVARGQHLATAITKCVGCHGPDLGGSKFIDDPALGSIAASNLTSGRGGTIGNYDDAALERVIRHGVKSDGTPALVMPSEEYANLTDEDLAAVIAYVRSVPPVDRELAPKSLRFLGRALVTGGALQHAFDMIDHSRASLPTIAVGETVEYGRYLTNVGGCTGCHGPGLSGGKIPGTPPDFKPAANITPTGIGHYTEADFFRALREGVRPGGAPIDTSMPFRLTKDMTDVEIKAVYAFLKTVPPKEYGNR